MSGPFRAYPYGGGPYSGGRDPRTWTHYANAGAGAYGPPRNYYEEGVAVVAQCDAREVNMVVRLTGGKEYGASGN